MVKLVRVRDDEITAGSPLRFPVFDQSGALLYCAGIVIASAGIVRLLLGRGLYRDPDSVGLSNCPQGEPQAASRPACQ